MAALQYLGKKGPFVTRTLLNTGTPPAALSLLLLALIQLPAFSVPELIQASIGTESMGNCLVLQAKMVKITRMDGEILQYPSPLKVQQVLDEFPGHAISDALPVISYLEPEEFMSHEREYYLFPPKKPVTETGDQAGVVRIKLVLTKLELKQMLRKGGISPEGMLSFVQREQSSRSEKEKSMGWRPSLKSIPEGDDSAVSFTNI